MAYRNWFRGSYRRCSFRFAVPSRNAALLRKLAVRLKKPPGSTSRAERGASLPTKGDAVPDGLVGSMRLNTTVTRDDTEVRSGSDSDLGRPVRHVRSTPDSDQIADIAGGSGSFQ